MLLAQFITPKVLERHPSAVQSFRTMMTAKDIQALVAVSKMLWHQGGMHSPPIWHQGDDFHCRPRPTHSPLRVGEIVFCVEHCRARMWMVRATPPKSPRSRLCQQKFNITRPDHITHLLVAPFLAGKRYRKGI